MNNFNRKKIKLALFLAVALISGNARAADDDTNPTSVEVVGDGNLVSYAGGVAIGHLNVSSGDAGATAIGYVNEASGGHGATAIGIYNVVSGESGATAIGYGNEVSDDIGATAIGVQNTVAGDYGATAIGMGNSATAESSMAFGTDVTNNTINSLAIGFNNAASTDSALTVQGSAASTKVGVATSSPQSVLHVQGSFQLDNVTMLAPSAGSCNVAYQGRMQIVNNGMGTYLYLCAGSDGWKKAKFQ